MIPLLYSITYIAGVVSGVIFFALAIKWSVGGDQTKEI